LTIRSAASEEKILIYEDRRFVYAARINALHLRGGISVSCLAQWQI
jgi:hypothetical protein